MTRIERGHWGLPRDYAHRWPVTYYDDPPGAFRLQTWQSAVYDAATKAMLALGSRCLVDVGCGSGEKTYRAAGASSIGFDFGANIASARKAYPDADWYELDFDSANALPVAPAVLDGAVLVCADVIEHLENPDRLLQLILGALDHAALAIISTPDRGLTAGSAHMGPPTNEAHVREWTALELIELIRSLGYVHAVITWTPPHDLTTEASSITIFAASDPKVLQELNLTKGQIAGLIVAPPRRNAPILDRLERISISARRQSRRSQLRLLGRRRSY
jgi:SAM-dependent methyltransferase